MSYEDNPKSIKYYVKRHLIENANFYSGKKVLDFPAGNGITSRILQEVGAIPIPADLFPEYFNIDGLECIRANIRDGLPIDEESMDAIICQEGIEHFSDQFDAFRQFNKALKSNGILLITTPNYSNLRAKLSYLLMESERYNDLMPPNEVDSIWMSEQSITSEVYFGHIFLIGIQKLRVLAKLSGFKIKKIHFTKAKSTSLLLFPLLYPFIRLSSWITLRKNLGRVKGEKFEEKAKVYREIFRLAVDSKILIQGHLMVEFEKEGKLEDVTGKLKSKYDEFGVT